MTHRVQFNFSDAGSLNYRAVNVAIQDCSNMLREAAQQVLVSQLTTKTRPGVSSRIHFEHDKVFTVITVYTRKSTFDIADVVTIISNLSTKTDVELFKMKPNFV